MTWGEFRILQLCSILITLCVCLISEGDAHGRLIEPPSRASAWRYGFQTPPDYNDHELYCGGFTRQWKRNGGKCGECGDAWDMPLPRPHENGGQWGQGVIVRSYLPSAEMTIRVELTASHMGYFEFRLCPEANAKQPCLDKNVLKVMGGSPSQPNPSDLDTRFYPRNGSRIYDIKARLPDMICDQCVLQWRYVAGNNWGMCDDGVGAVGCGPQEEFRACSDIALTTDARTPIRPFRPTVRTSVSTSSKPTTSTEQSQGDLDVDASAEPFNYTPIVVCGLVLFLVLCALAAWYFYRYNQPKISERFAALSQRFCMKPNPKKNSNLVASAPQKILPPFVLEKHIPCPPLEAPPVPPPRTKRNSRVKEMSADESSIA